MCPQTATRKPAAFTLVELLVVVGIISILVAILMPVISRAREHARRVTCASNLRTIGHGLTMYTQQYGYYPAMEAGEVNGMSGVDAAMWTVRVRRFLPNGKDVFHCPSRDEQARWTDTGPLPLMPAQPGSVFVSLGYEPGEPLIHARAYFSYGYNGWGMSEVVGSIMDGTHRGLGVGISVGNRLNIRELPASRVRVPEDMIAVTDANADGSLDFGTMPRAENPTTCPGKVHGGGANVLFCDGHVTWYRLEELLITNKRDPAQWPRIRRWNNDHSLGRAPGSEE